MTTALSISTLGAFEVRFDERPVVGLSSGKMSALLIYLAMTAGHRHRREALAALFWPDLPVEAARSNLRHVVFHLRHVLEDGRHGPPFLLSERDWLSFDRHRPYRLDTVELTAPVPACVASPTPEHCRPCVVQMEYMAGLYRGRFMGELALPECPDVDDWLQVQAEALQRRALALLERLSDCYEQSRAYAKALPFAQRFVEIEPWQEAGHHRFIRLLALDRQRGAALAQYDACCRALRHGPGVAPGDGLRLLVERIRADALTLDTAEATGVAPVACMAPMPATLPAAERRRVTVVACDLVPADSDDPDAVLALLHAPRLRAIGIIRRFSGHVVQTHGGGLLAYFGYPLEHGDAPVQALYAARELARENAVGLDVRVGVHTGLIAISGNPTLPDLVGTASTLAGRLRLVAEAGEVVLSGETQRLVQKHFDCIALGEQRLRGIARPVEVFRLIGERGVC